MQLETNAQHRGLTQAQTAKLARLVTEFKRGLHRDAMALGAVVRALGRRNPDAKRLEAWVRAIVRQELAR